MNKQIVLKLIAGLILLSILVTACAPTASSGLPKEITLGAVEDLTGPTAAYGLSIQQGIDLAVKQINEQKFIANGVTLKVNYEDAAGDPAKAAGSFKKLTADSNISAIIGPTLSSQALAADPLAQQAKMPVVASSNTASGITEIGDYIFRTSLPESAVIPNTINTVSKALNLKKVVIIYGTDDAYTTGAEKVFKDSLTQTGIEILTEETFLKGDTDFSAQLAKIKALNPDAIIVAALVEEAAKIMVQARQLGIPVSVRFIGGNSFNSPKLAQLAGRAAEGAISGSAWNLTSAVQTNINFVQAFNAEYGSKPDQFAAQSYTAAWVVAFAIKNANSVDRTLIRDALTRIKNFDTPLGPFSFSANRDPLHSPVVQVVIDGKFELFQP